MLVKASTDQFSKGPDGESRIKYYAVKVFSQELPDEDNMLLKRLRIF